MLEMYVRANVIRSELRRSSKDVSPSHHRDRRSGRCRDRRDVGREVAPHLSRLARAKAHRFVPVPIDPGFATATTLRSECISQLWRSRVTSRLVSPCVRCRLEAAATNVAAPPRPTSSAQGRKDPRTRPPGRPQIQAWPPWCRTRSRRSPDRSGRGLSLHRLRRGCTAERRLRSLPVLRRIALGHRRRFRFDAGRRDSGRSGPEPALPRR